MASSVRAALVLLIMLTLSVGSATPVHASGDADCNWLGNCELSDTKPGKPGGGGSGGGNGDKAPDLPDCAAFPKASDTPPDDPTGWVQVGCMEGSIAITLWVEGGASPQQIAQSLLAQVQLRPIGIGLVPRGNNVMTVVGMPVWLWVDEPSRTTWGPATISAGGMTLTAKVQSVTWDMGDGTTLTCGKGTEWKKGMGGDPSPTCGHTYDEQGRYTITARSHWLARWSGYGQSGTIPVTLSTSRVLEVGEIQVIGTGR